MRDMTRNHESKVGGEEKTFDTLSVVRLVKSSGFNTPGVQYCCLIELS